MTSSRDGDPLPIALDPALRPGDEPGTMLWGDGFEVETLINVRIAKTGLRVFELPSFERDRYFGTSNLNAFSDGLRVLRTIHIERQWGSRRQLPQSRIVPRDGGSTWSHLSTAMREAV